MYLIPSQFVDKKSRKITLISFGYVFMLSEIVLYSKGDKGGRGGESALVDLSKLKLRWWTDSSGYVGATRHTSKIQIQLYILYVTNALRNKINPFCIITITEKNKTQKQQ
uniref:Uncharacterized protein n=1 Tax=Glossina palpalis gambiensis TaxID=67801 RepID=A0A1B0BMC7_9MUSC